MGTAGASPRPTAEFEVGAGTECCPLRDHLIRHLLRKCHLFARRETAPLLSATPTFSPAIGGNRPRGEGWVSAGNVGNSLRHGKAVTPPSEREAWGAEKFGARCEDGNTQKTPSTEGPYPGSVNYDWRSAEISPIPERRRLSRCSCRSCRTLPDRTPLPARPRHSHRHSRDGHRSPRRRNAWECW